MDWITVTGKADIRELAKWATRAYQVEFEDTGHGYRWWGISWRGTGGAMAQGENRGHEEWSAVELPGGVVHRSLARVRRSVRTLARFAEWRCTRLDVAWDGSGVGPREMWAAWRAGKVRTGGERFDWRENAQGQTFYLGRDAKGRGELVLCVYNGRGFNRVELRVYGVRALALLASLAVLSDREWEAQCRGVLAGFVDVAMREWADLIQGAALVHLAGDRHASRSIETNRAAVRRHAKAIAIFTRVNGVEALWAVVRDGARRLSLRELAEFRLSAAPAEAYWPVVSDGE